PFHLTLDSAQVLANERENESLDAEDEDDSRAAEEGPGEVRVLDPEDDAVDTEAERRERADDAHDQPDPLDRLRPESGQHVQRESRKPQRRVARPSLSRYVRDVDLDDARAAGEDQRLRELLTPDRAEHRFDGPAAVRVERAPEVGDRDAGEAPQHSVDQPRRQCATPRIA